MPETSMILELTFPFYYSTSLINKEIEAQIKWVNKLNLEDKDLEVYEIECNSSLYEELLDIYKRITKINPNKKDNHYILKFRSQ